MSGYVYNSEPLNHLLSGNMTTSINVLMEQKLGGFWYSLFFFTPAVLIYLKTESLIFTGIYLIWAMTFYGTFMFPQGIGAEWVTVLVTLTVAGLIYKALTPAK